jgi:UDP-N-acetylmuramoylalanine--D-glutamate ligase
LSITESESTIPIVKVNIVFEDNPLTFSTPTQTNSHQDYIVVMGMGKTGLACLDFLVKHDYIVRIMDNRTKPPGLTTLKQTFPQIPAITGRFDVDQLAQAAEIVISPGISRREPALAKALALGIPVISEIELFARYKNAPVVAITGSNGKSTVTTLLGEMAKQAGWQVQVGGNLGTPALELLCTPAPDLYILELSSFQLESTYSLNPKAAVVLNISEDHQDRYTDMKEYIEAKQRIYQGDGIVVWNADDPKSVAMLPPNRQYLSFSLHHERGDFRVWQGKTNEEISPNPSFLKGGTSKEIPPFEKGELERISVSNPPYLCRAKDNEVIPLLSANSMKLPGAIMRSNALAALALGEAIGLPQPAMLEALQTFQGLKHRCAWVAHKQNIDFYNDSKGTNVGATIAAIQGLEKPGQIILIAGGDGKGADFLPLREVVAAHCRACILLGHDGPLIAQILANTIPLHHANTLEEAVTKTLTLAHPGDAVLLSPACASFDMFNNYEHRGEIFENAVKRLD